MTNISTESGVSTGNAAAHAPVSEGSPVLEAAALAEETIGLVIYFGYGRKHSLMNPDSPRHEELVEMHRHTG